MPKSAKKRGSGLYDASLYGIWHGMIRRCTDTECRGYRHYGGRGIKVCQRWIDSYDDFVRDMGPRPSPKHTIDRFPDNNGDYEPDNARWAGKSEQMLNTRRTRRLTYQGETLLLTEWAYRLGVHPQTINLRLKRGMSVDEALGALDLRSRPFEFEGRTQTIKEWAEEYQVEYSTLYYRLQAGWSLEDALKVPTGAKRPGEKPRGRYLTCKGETLLLSEWAKRLGLCAQTIWGRLKRGMSVEETLTNPDMHARHIEINGRTQSITAWADEYKMETSTVSYRIRHGWDPQQALTVPAGGKRNGGN